MILDSRLEFADAVSVANAAGTFLIGNVVDLGSVVRDIGNGDDDQFIINIDTAVIAASAGTIQFQLVSDAQAAIAVDGSASVHYRSQSFVTNVIASTALKAGLAAVEIALPMAGATPYERYLGVLAVIGTATVTAGKINAFITKDKYGNITYPRASN